MSERSGLRGMAWDHPRARGPLEAISAEWSREGGVSIAWDARPLKDFEDQPLEELAERFRLSWIHAELCARTQESVARPHAHDAIASRRQPLRQRLADAAAVHEQHPRRRTGPRRPGIFFDRLGTPLQPMQPRVRVVTTRIERPADAQRNGIVGATLASPL